MIVLAGPTASGKTELAVRLASRLGAEIVSADSRQVYRLLDAATAKPSAAQRAAVPHHLIDVADPSEIYDAARFAAAAAAAAAAIKARGKVPLVVGGTGLYLQALLEGLAPLPPRDAGVRGRLEALAAREGREALHARLAQADPKAAAAIPAGNLQRVVRALEVLELTGKPISAHWDAGRAGARPASAVLRLEVPHDLLNARIEERARAMWQPLLEEVRALVPRRFRGDEPGFTSLGYREAVAVLRGQTPDADGFAALVRATRAYAKRQRTWFRGRLDATPVPAGRTPEESLTNTLAVLEDADEKSAVR